MAERKVRSYYYCCCCCCCDWVVRVSWVRLSARVWPFWLLLLLLPDARALHVPARHFPRPSHHLPRRVFSWSRPWVSDPLSRGVSRPFWASFARGWEVGVEGRGVFAGEREGGRMRFCGCGVAFFSLGFCFPCFLLAGWGGYGVDGCGFRRRSEWLWEKGGRYG